MTPEDEVVVRDLAGHPISQLTLAGPGEIVDVEPMTDINADAAPELAALRWDPGTVLTAEVRELRTGQMLSSVAYTAG